MTIENIEIVKKIKEARLKRNMTQQDLANVLGKTAAAISDMERGKVQVSARDLSKIADLLNTPIEFFYGEELGDQEINDIVTLLRKEAPEGRAKSLATIKMLLQMQQIGDKVQLDPEKEITPKDVGEFFTSFISLAKQVKEMSTQLDDLQNKFMQEIKAQGISIPGLSS